MFTKQPRQCVETTAAVHGAYIENLHRAVYMHNVYTAPKEINETSDIVIFIIFYGCNYVCISYWDITLSQICDMGIGLQSIQCW